MILFFQRKIQTLDVLVKKAMVCRRNLVDEGKTKGNSPFDLIRIPSRFCTLLDKGCPV